MPKEFLEMRNVVKVYGGIKALNNVDLVLKKGELLCLLGENGAGKSTLMKILSGVVQPTSGEIYFKGEKLEIKNPDQAHKAGFSTVYQEMVQLPDMSISENIFVGRYPKKKSGLIDFKRLRSMTLELMDRLAQDLPQDRVEYLQEVFVNCSRYELGFWEMAWQLER